MRVSVIISIFERLRELELELARHAPQDDTDFEVVVADDGFGSATVAVIAAAARRSSPWSGLRHVGHPDQGFCKNEILDHAICASVGGYLLFSDGDCIPRPDFVSTHRGLAIKERFLSGGYVRLSSSLVSGPRAWGRGRRLDLGLRGVHETQARGAASVTPYAAAGTRPSPPTCRDTDTGDLERHERLSLERRGARRE